MVIVPEYRSREIFVTIVTDEKEDDIQTMNCWLCFGELEVLYLYVRIFL